MEEHAKRSRFAGYDLDRRTGQSSIESALGLWLSCHGRPPRRDALGQLWKNWDIVMGPELSAAARPLGARNDVLLVGCDDQCAMQELSYSSSEILERANAFMNGDCFARVEFQLMLGRGDLRNAETTVVAQAPPPERPACLGKFTPRKGSPVSAAYEAYVRCFEDSAEPDHARGK